MHHVVRRVLAGPRGNKAHAGRGEWMAREPSGQEQEDVVWLGWVAGGREAWSPVR